MPDWRCERDCICMLRRPGWPISTLSYSPSHMNTKPYNFLWHAQRRCSPVAFAFKLQHSQTQAKMQTFWKLYQAKKCLAFILRRVHSVAAASLMFSSDLSSCGFTLGFSENLAPGEVQGEKLGEFTGLLSRWVTAKKAQWFSRHSILFRIPVTVESIRKQILQFMETHWLTSCFHWFEWCQRSGLAAPLLLWRVFKYCWIKRSLWWRWWQTHY